MTTEKHNYTLDFDSERFPVWYIDTDETVAYHLYPNCSHIDHRRLPSLSKASIPSIQASNANSFKEWEERLISNRHMCKHCLNRVKKDWWEANF